MFSGTDIHKVEDEVNKFFQKSRQITVHSICQSSDSHKVFISIYFNVKTKASIVDEQPIEQVETIIAKAELH